MIPNNTLKILGPRALIDDNNLEISSPNQYNAVKLIIANRKLSRTTIS